MPLGTIALLGAFAGLSIYLGLPFARLKQVKPALRTFLSMTATGVLLFLLYDVVAHMSDAINADLAIMHSAMSWKHVGAVVAEVLVLVAGLLLGTVGLVAFNRQVTERIKFTQQPSRNAGAVAPAPAKLALAATGNLAKTTRAKPTVVQAAAQSVPAPRELVPEQIALIIAAGIGLHNFSEGLAIGQSAASGALQLAAVLIVGFGLHNMTEGFGIAGPLTGRTVSWKFLGLLGLIGGGPTFLGTIVGMVVHASILAIFFLALAAGAIIYVVAELLGVARKANAPMLVMGGLVLGFMLGYLTDMIITFAGA